MSRLDRFRRRRPPPEALRGLAPADRLLAWGLTADQAVVAASVRGLRLPGGRLLAWHGIDKAAWRSPDLTLTEAVEVAPGVAESRPPVVLVLADPGDLPAVVRSRVTGSVAYTAHHRLPAGGGVRVVARRIAGQDGLAWSLRYDDAVDGHDAGSQAAAEQLLAAARASLTPAQ